MTTTVANMTAGRARSTGDLDMGRVLRVGAVTGAVMIYVSAIGMLATFNARLIINPILSIGYTLFFAIPFIAGTRFTQRQQLEGLTAEKPSGLDVVKALVAGAVGGLMVALFALVIDSFPEVRSTFPNLSPEMVEVITLGLGVGVGLVVIPAISAGVAAVGAAISFLPDRYRRAIAIGALTVVAFAMFQAVVDDFFDWLPALPDFLYQTPSGVSVVPAIILFLLGAAGSLFLPGRISSVGAGLRSQEGAARRRTTIIWAVVIGAALIVLPQFLGGILNELFVNVGFFALMALGLNVVIGYAGLLDLGYVAFFAVGAYTTGVLTSPISPTWDPMLSWWQAFPVVLVMAALAGLFVGTPVLRMRGDYLAIVTLGFGEIVRLLLLSDWLSPYFGGAQGIRNIPGIPVFGTEINVTTPNLMIYMVAFFVLLAAFISWRLEHSRIGRAWAALREDEDVAEAVGVDTVKAKLTAFITGAVIASFAGALFAAKVGSVFTNSFEILVSIVILVIVIVGGMGNIVGVVVGAFVLIGILGGPNQPGLLQEFGEYRLLMYGALLVFMMLRRPEGLVPSKRRQQELHQEEFLQDAWLDKGGHFVNPDDHTPQRPGPSAAEPGRGKE
jgi:branched-chain amino acid transport system permease protein